MLVIKYFASLREKLGSSGEKLPWQPEFQSIADLKKFLVQRNSNWEPSLSQPTVMIAVNQKIANDQTQLRDGDEVAFFPPVTGG